MLLRPSEFLWSNLAILQRLQFPWRWLSLISFQTVVVFTLSLPLLVKVNKFFERAVLWGVAFTVILFAAYDVRRMSTAPFRIKRTEFNQLARDFQSEATSVAWWPVWATEAALQAREPVTAANRTVHIKDWESERRKFVIGEGIPTHVRVATFYYPYWHASVNGRPVDVQKDKNGTITLPIGEEPSEIELSFDEPPLYTAVSWLSLLAWTFFLGAVGFRLARRFRSGRSGMPDEQASLTHPRIRTERIVGTPAIRLSDRETAD